MTLRPTRLFQASMPCMAFMLLAMLALAACTPEAPPTAPATTAIDASSAATANSVAPATSDDPAAAAQTGEPAPIDPQAAAVVQAANDAADHGPALVAGTDYIEIPNGHPWQPLNGKIEVVEVFGYVCPACARFQPLVNAWKAKLGDDVRFSYVPAPFGPEWIPYAKAFYVAQSQGLVERSHDAVFHAIHLTGEIPGEGKQPDEAAIAQFYGQYGVDPEEFLAAMNSFGTHAKVNRGKQFMISGGINSTPTLVINGKYRVLGKSLPDMLRIASQLIAQERSAAQ